VVTVGVKINTRTHSVFAKCVGSECYSSEWIWSVFKGRTQDRECACDVTLKPIFATIVAVEKR